MVYAARAATEPLSGSPLAAGMSMSGRGGVGAGDKTMRHDTDDADRLAVGHEPALRGAAVTMAPATSGTHEDHALVEALRRAEQRADEAERRLHRWEERFSVLATVGSQWIWTTDAAGMAKEDLTASRPGTDQRRDELLDFGWSDAIHPDDRERALADWERAVASRQPYESVQRVRGLDGAYRYMLVRGLPVWDADDAVREWVGTSIDITDRKRLEHEATERAAQLEAVFEAMADGVLVYDEHGTIMRANQAARALMGYDGRAGFFERPSDERAATYELTDANGDPLSPDAMPVRRILRGETFAAARSEDYHVRTLDDRAVLLNLSGAPVRGEGERITGGVIVMRDVEGRRRLEREMEEQAREIAGVIEGIPDGVVVYGPEGEIRFVNAAYKALLALDDDEIRRPFAARGAALSQRDPQTGEPLPQERWPGARVQHGDVLVGAGSVDVIVRAHDGRDVFLNCAGAPIRDDAGHVRGAVMVIRDVEERLRLERRTSDALAALLEIAEALVRPTYEGASSTLITTPPLDGGRRSAVAQRLADLTRDVLGCTRVGITVVEPETRQMRAVAVVGLTPEEETRWWEEQAQIERQGLRLGDGADPAELARFEAGEAFVIDMTKPPFDALPNPYGITTCLALPMRAGETVVGVLSLDYGGPVHDFTAAEMALGGAVANLAAWVIERDRLLSEREESRAQVLALEQANQRLDEFLSVASHELRTPLTTIKMNVQIASRRAARLAASMRDAANEGTNEGASELDMLESLLARTEQAIRRQDLLVTDLLDVSRIQSGKLQLRPEPLDLAAVVKDAVEEQRLAHPGRAIHLSAPRRHIATVADADRVRQVVANYLTNALKYSTPADPVEVRLAVEGASARVSVQDRGPGIPAEERESVWERFHQVGANAPRSGSGVGLGLGLYISREIVERHGGAVGVESAAGEGATFWFTLPLADDLR
jgi:PAS domain S-box-containing protein